MTDPDPDNFDVPLAHLPPPAKARRSGSFGQVASHYERYRPGPPVGAVDWLLPSPVATVVDLGAGTGALARLLVDRSDRLIAVEPDDRMRAVLTEQVPGIEAISGRGEAIPLPDHSVDAVLASSSWHWMDPLPALREVARVLVPGGILGALWSGPDPDGPFIAQARELLATRSEGSAAGAGVAGGEGTDDLQDLIIGDALRPMSTLEISGDVPFEQPEREVFTWNLALNADELIGLLSTLSWVITMPETSQTRLFAEARRLLRDLLGIEGETTVDVAFRCDTWRARRHGRSG